ncbi:hypothetical protein [Burkholderia pseudomultivorans]|nr:hypothetical protein [Burkholderia pseudomultivorans]
MPVDACRAMHGISETEMETAGRSLRDRVESWLAPNRAVPVRVRAQRHAAGGRCVRVEATVPNGAVEICFFRHDDGAWHLFPPDPRRVTMRIG